MSLSACVDSFILAILCGNPIMKGTFISVLNAMILQIDQELSLEIAQLGRLNIVNQILNIEIQAMNAIINKSAADLNLILAPLQASGSCPELNRLLDKLTNSSGGKFLAGIQRKIYEYNRKLNVATIQDAATKKKQQLRSDLQAIVNRINVLCP